MKKIAIYCVNYNSYDSLKDYLASIDIAAGLTQEKTTLSVFVADNTIPCLDVAFSPRNFTLQVLSTGENKGYFGAVHFLMEKISPDDFDYTIISNVDVLLTEDFFTRLFDLRPDRFVGWIAPQIHSRLEQRDRNPKIMQRYSKRKLQVLKALFHFPLLYNLYTHTFYKSKKLIHHEPGDIYAGHGSFIILTQNYFQRCGIINYPVFLFCEEIYLGEQCHLHQLKVVYEPTVSVIDTEHASTGTIKRNKYCRYNQKAINYILKTYY